MVHVKFELTMERYKGMLNKTAEADPAKMSFLGGNRSAIFPNIGMVTADKINSREVVKKFWVLDISKICP
jgi:hypothetical protein